MPSTTNCLMTTTSRPVMQSRERSTGNVVTRTCACTPHNTSSVACLRTVQRRRTRQPNWCTPPFGPTSGFDGGGRHRTESRSMRPLPRTSIAWTSRSADLIDEVGAERSNVDMIPASVQQMRIIELATRGRARCAGTHTLAERPLVTCTSRAKERARSDSRTPWMDTPSES